MHHLCLIPPWASHSYDEIPSRGIDEHNNCFIASHCRSYNEMPRTKWTNAASALLALPKILALARCMLVNKAEQQKTGSCVRLSLPGLLAVDLLHGTPANRVDAQSRCILSLVLSNLFSHHGASHWWNVWNVDQHNQRTMCVTCFMHSNCGSHQWNIGNGATQLENHVCLVHPGICCCGSNEEFIFQSKPLNCLVSILELRAQPSSQPAVLGSQSVKCQSLSCERNCLPTLPYLAVKA